MKRSIPVGSPFPATRSIGGSTACAARATRGRPAAGGAARSRLRAAEGGGSCGTRWSRRSRPPTQHVAPAGWRSASRWRRTTCLNRSGSAWCRLAACLRRWQAPAASRAASSVTSGASGERAASSTLRPLKRVGRRLRPSTASGSASILRCPRNCVVRRVALPRAAQPRSRSRTRRVAAAALDIRNSPHLHDHESPAVLRRERLRLRQPRPTVNVVAQILLDLGERRLDAGVSGAKLELASPAWSGCDARVGSLSRARAVGTRYRRAPRSSPHARLRHRILVGLLRHFEGADRNSAFADRNSVFGRPPRRRMTSSARLSA